MKDKLMVNVQVQLIRDAESGKIVAYCPAFELSTFGDTREEAKKFFEEALDLFLDELISSGDVEGILTELGWQKKDCDDWIPPAHVIETVTQNVSIPIC